MGLTRPQQQILMRVSRKDYTPLSELELAEVPGFHFCPDWDFMPICDDSPEKEACLCAALRAIAEKGGK